MHVHPENGKSTLLSMLSVGLYSNKVTFMHVHPGNGKSTLHSMLSVGFLQQQSYAFMHVHPGNRKSTLLSMLSLGLYSNKVTRLCMCMQETENLYFTFYAFIFVFSATKSRVFCSFSTLAHKVNEVWKWHKIEKFDLWPQFTSCANEGPSSFHLHLLLSS